MRSTFLKSTLGSAFALLVMSPFIHGNVPTPGGPAVPPDVFSYLTYCAGDMTCSAQVVPGTYLTGTYSVSTIPGPGGTVTQTGTYDTIVITDAVTGNLDFLYQFEPLTGTDPVISQINLFDFGGVTVDMGFDPTDFFSNLGPGSRAPDQVQSGAGGSSLDFHFNPDVLKNQVSDLLIVETDAHYYTAGAFGFQDGTVGSVAAFAPAAVPEPTSILLFGGALVLACSAIRRRLQNS